MQHKADSSESSTERQNPSLDVGEFLSLKQPTNYWTFICSYCTKSFPSPQSLGGHQNAHRRERNEERRLYTKNPLAYRKRALLRSVKPLNVVPNKNLPVTKASAKTQPPYDPPSELTLKLGHGPWHRYRQGEGPSSTVRQPMGGYGFPFKALDGNIHFLSSPKHVDWKPKLALDLNLLPARELTADDHVGGGTRVVVRNDAAVPAEEGSNFQRLDLTLKL